MSPIPPSPPNMSHPLRTASTDSTSDSIRKRVCKACDRCRLKKSKCDGSHPCSRCRADNAICVFGERKKSHDKVYPKGYVEMLEQQQGQLVSGLQEMYRRSLAEKSWNGPTLSEANGHPLTHDILASLDLLETKHDGSGEVEMFEEDYEKLQSKLLANGASFVHRRGSVSSDSEHSQRDHGRSTQTSTPTFTKPPVFDKNFTFSATPSPATRSPVPRQRQSYPLPRQSPMPQAEPIANDPRLYQPEWSMDALNNPEALMRSKFALQTPRLSQDLGNAAGLFNGSQWDQPSIPLDLGMGMGAYAQQYNPASSFDGLQDYLGMMESDSDFQQFIDVAT